MDYSLEYRKAPTIDLLQQKSLIEKKLWRNPRVPFRLESAEFRDITFKQFKYRKDPKSQTNHRVFFDKPVNRTKL